MVEDQDIYDVIIIGAGPIGLTCAIEAQKNGLKYLLIDKGSLVNSVYHFPTNMTFFSTSKLLEIGDVPFISHRDKPSRSEALEYFRRVFEAWELDAKFYEKVEAVNRLEEGFLIQTAKSTYHSKFIVVST